MRVLIVHNRYQLPGGEDVVASGEAELLRAKGHNVVEFVRSNVMPTGAPGWLSAATSALWASDTRHDLSQAIATFRPEIVHFHNFWHRISPAAHWAAKAMRVPVVQTLHNYRLLCVNAQLVRNGRPCELCVRRLAPYLGIVFRCYRSSLVASAAACAMVGVHRMIRTWSRKVDVYVALTEFARRKFIEAGLPADRIVVKPNFVTVSQRWGESREEYVVAVGRLSAEKGMLTLLEAWKRLPGVPLRIIGDGPLRGEMETLVEASSLGNVTLQGQQPRQQVLAEMARAQFLVFPSEIYEGLPLTILEAFGLGLAVVASDLGAMKELVHAGKDGLLFPAGDVDALVRSVRVLWSSRERLASMQREARLKYERHFAPEINYPQLLETYRLAQELASRRQTG